MTTRNEKQQNDYLKVILEEVRGLASQLKKLDVEVKDLKKQLNVVITQTSANPLPPPFSPQ
jgi:cell shape-determining protein MreC